MKHQPLTILFALLAFYTFHLIEADEIHLNPIVDAAPLPLPRKIDPKAIPIERKEKDIIRVQPIDHAALLPIRRKKIRSRIKNSVPQRINLIEPIMKINQIEPKLETLTTTTAAPTKMTILKNENGKFQHYLYDINGMNKQVVKRMTFVHYAPDAYPVNYKLAKNNGKFLMSSLKTLNTDRKKKSLKKKKNKNMKKKSEIYRIKYRL